MDKFLVKEDIYDQRGLLLLRKGETINKSTLERLKKFSISVKSIPGTGNIKPDIASKTNKDRFNNKFKIRNSKLIDYPSEILDKIIFQSKKQPWWFHINLLSNYVDWLYTHSIDTSLISLMIGIQMDYTDAQLWNLGLGSLLHDIGELLVPKDILNQTKPLDGSEKIIFRQHCVLGANSIRSYNVSNECVDIILHHHERLDGSGYPDGLKGNEISLNCQIVMVSDAIDAISSGRTYHNPKSMDEAINIIRNDSEKFSTDILNIIAMLCMN